ncbi:DUF6907 domain-containing protein [Streptomyces sp. NPDC001889]
MSSIRRCPDGRAWCTGLPLDHAGPDDRLHSGPEYAMTGSYAPGPLLSVQLMQWGDGTPAVSLSESTWPDLTETQLDALIDDLALHLHRIRLLRAQLARLAEGGPAPCRPPGVGGDELRMRALLAGLGVCR